VLVENEVVIEHRPVEIAEAIEFSRYHDAGGRLPEATYNKAQEALQERDIKYQQFGEPIHKKQASGCVIPLGFELKPEQIFLYCFLAESRMRGSLSDQGIVGEVLLITKDIKKYSAFTLARPNIF